MKPRNLFYLVALLIAIAGGIGLLTLAMASPPASLASSIPSSPSLSPAPPTTTVKLIFIHHSCGENWLADDNGGLGIALRDNNYFVSDTNYGWGPDSIGDRTDIPNWPEWFVGPNAITYTTALYTEYNQNSSYSRLASDPGGENTIIMFKSCFPNSGLEGNPNDPPLPEPDDSLTVANAKAVYNTILTYFATRQDKLFIVITAPPLAEAETTAAQATNARAFNNWLVNDWLDTYHHNNVAVFDFYNVLTSNGGNPDTNDYAQRPIGNHHYWDGTQITHTQTVSNNFSAYPSGDSHPTAAGNQKATAEFVPLLNVIYNRWKSGGTPCTALTGVSISGPTSGYTDTQYTFTAGVAPANASTPISYTWTPAPASGQGTMTARYTWPTVGAKVITVTVQNCGGSAVDTHTITLTAHPTPSHFLYLPLILRNYAPAPPACAVPLTGVTITGPMSGGTSLLPVNYAQFTINHPSAPLAAQPTGLTALHRSGQTFLTWNENTSVSGESYHVYRHTAPINASNIAQATRLTAKWGPLPEGSSIFYTDRDRDPAGSLFTGLRNYVITPLGSQLTDTVGLFVWTTKQTGNYYYAVTTVDAGGVENLTDFGAGNSLAAAVAETVADPAPVMVWQSPSGNGRVYTQFMDYATFNPTFERPYAHPDGGLQYAYNYFVGLPTPEQCGGSLPSSMPIILHIEGYGSRYVAEYELGDHSSYFCALEIWGDDPRQSWYYGFSATYDYRSGDPTSTPPGSGPIVNYTEERLLRSIYDTLRDPDYAAYHLDANRIYVYGHSMGGSGALALAMRYPNVFAASYSSEPMTNYSTSGDGGGENWRNDTVPKWGTIAANLPISNVGRYAGHLAAYNGTGVWDWQNHQANLVNRRGDDMAHISLAHGANDTVIEWSTQGQPAYGAFYQGRRAFSGATVAAGHDWIGFNGMGPNVTADLGAPFYNFSVVRNESLPGLSNASGSSVTPPPGADAAYNLNLEWSSSWDNWDGAPIDTAGQWRISLRTTDGSNQTVDVTPRRLQTFHITPGANYAWENRRVSDNGLVASGTVAADAYGLVTVQNFAVTPGGNRLLLQPAGGPAQPTLTLTAPNGGESWQVGSQHLIQWTTTGSIPNVSLSYSTDGFATSHTIVASIANTGSYNWTIPNTPATTARVRVSSVVTPSIHDDSDANFTIQSAGGSTTYIFTATITPPNATPPVVYTWSPAPLSGQGTAVASYQWTTPGTYVITVTVTNCGGTFADTHTITIGGAPTQTVRPFPDTTNGIHVFNDQLANMSEEQFQFAATHYVGTQKMTRADADHLRTYNPNFIILNYRLGMGLGYRGIESGCTPSGDWLSIIDGNDWVQEWPGDGNVVEDWFYHWPEASTTRVLNCDWGWYLMNLDNAAWRTYWSGEVLRLLQTNADDGIFADSFSVPNYLGYDHYNPNLPELDNTFESQWATRLNNFMTYVQQGSLAPYHFIPNAGQWVTSRETTDYSIADGVMIEGFGGWGYASYFDLADWQLQMDRILGLVNQDKIILAQQYINADDVNDRMFLLSSYLLIKGRYTYINFDLDLDPEWFPEYSIPIGSPIGGTPANIAALWNADWGVYTRAYSNGRVLVNPTAITQTVALGQTYYRATPNGGGFVPADGDVSAWTVSYTPVTSVELAPNRGAVLLNAAP
ncbi:MAG TPA: putative glycoside hydrolase [Anaerolineae bacterium]|mgnify:CR=1 FL=1|nr:putative glycoside hydrolase [Anaerolineae bacterium]HQK13083.1 putative glycoside hydrolase [Anaerolineae bacterium]